MTRHASAIGFRASSAVALLASMLSAQALGEAPSESVIVLPPSAERVLPQAVSLFEELIVLGMHDARRYRVVAKSDIEAQLGLEKMKGALGCIDVACAVEIGSALGVRFLLASSVKRLGSRFLLSLTLIDTHKQRAVARGHAKIPNDEDRYEAGVQRALNGIFGAAGARATTRAKRVCNFTNVDGCVADCVENSVVASCIRAGSQLSQDAPVRAAEMYEKACSLGAKEACVWATSQRAAQSAQ